MAQLTIRPYGEDATAVSTLWQESLPHYPVIPEQLAQLLALPWGSHFVALLPGDDSAPSRLIGFCATYREVSKAPSAGSTAYLAVILIHPDFQGRGYGTTLINHSIGHLRNNCKTVKAGSSIPRFWPGVPTDLPDKVHAFFVNRGFKQDTGCKDFYQPLAAFTPPQYLLDRASSSGIAFAPLTPTGYPECIAALESKFPQWAAGYRSLHTENLEDEIMVAFDRANGNKQVGWCLMLEPGKSRLWTGFAFLPAVGNQTALIGGVGVSEDARGKGVGLGLICAAMEELKTRGGVDGVFIDSVALENFYEKVGFTMWREYKYFAMDM